MNFWKKVRSSIRVFSVRTVKSAGNIIVAGMAILLVYIVVIIVMNSAYCDLLKGTCIEADEFGGKKNVIRAKPVDENIGYTIKNKYKHDEFTQKIIPTDLGLSLTGEPVTINITGEWMPWFGDLDEKELKNYNTNKNFVCAVEKYNINNIDGVEYKFSNRTDENEFYYIKNYYSGINLSRDKNNKDKMTKVTGIEEPPERQKECWIVGGVGLYLGSFGLNGRTEPTAYHHIKADKLICNKIHWFDGKALKGSNLNRNYTIVKYSNEYDSNRSYTMSDFIKNYFSVSYYSDPDHYENSEEVLYDKDIFTETDNQLIYNIGLHEEMLKDRLLNKRDDGNNNNEFTRNISYGFIVANSITKFMQACYQVSKGIDGSVSRSYRSYFQYGPKTLYKNFSNVQNIKYEYGEKAKMLILDKYYSNNQGFYSIEIISGIEFDDANYIEKKIREVEFYLLGTPDENSRRKGGIVANIFNNILSNGFILFAKAILMLYVVYYGFRVIFGFKKDRNDRSVINNKDLMMTLVKFIIISIFLSPHAFTFFSETILSFVIDGTMGIIDLIAGIFSNNFNDNAIALTGGLKYANEVKSLSRNFAIVDEILNFFIDKALFAKVFAFLFNFNSTFGAGLIISIGVFLVLLFYAYKLIQSIVPFIFVLLQFALVLPLAPLFILFSLFQETSYIFQNWVKFILSKSLELIGFFTAFYFCTSIIDNFIKKLLNYRVCFKGLGDHLMGEGELNWFKNIMKKIFNRFLAVSIEGLPDNYFLYYMINIFITAILIFMFDIMVRDIMNILSSILTIDGASANTGGASAMSDATSGKFSLDSQFVEFNKNMGFAAIQKESRVLSATRGVLNLEKGLTENVKRNVKNVSTSTYRMAKAGTNFAIGGTKLVVNKVSNFFTKTDVFDAQRSFDSAKQNLSKATIGFLNSTINNDESDPKKRKNFMDFVKDVPVVGNKMSDAIESLNYKKEKQNRWAQSLQRVKNIWSLDRKKSEVNMLLSDLGTLGFKKYLKAMEADRVKKIFGEELGKMILNHDFKEDGIFKSRLIVKNMKDYLTRYANNGYMIPGMEDVNYDVFDDSEDGYGVGNAEILKRTIKSELLNEQKLSKTLRNIKKNTLINLIGSENADYLKSEKFENEDYVIDNLSNYFDELEKGTIDSLSVNHNISSKNYGKKFDNIDLTKKLVDYKKDKNEFIDLFNNMKSNSNIGESRLKEILGYELFNEIDQQVKDTGNISNETLERISYDNINRSISSELIKINDKEQLESTISTMLDGEKYKYVTEVLGENNVKKLKSKIRKKKTITDDELKNIKDYLQKFEENGHKKLDESINRDVTSKSYGVEKSIIEKTNRLIKAKDVKELNNELLNIAKEENGEEKISKILGEDNIKKLKGRKFTKLKKYELKNIRDYLKKFEDNGHKKLDDSIINRDVTSKSYGVEKSIIEKTNRLIKTKDVKELNNELLNIAKEENGEEKISKILGEDNAKKLKDKIDKKETIADNELKNVKDYLQKFEDNGHKKLDDSIINRDVTSDDYGRENKFVAIDNLLSNKDETNFKSQLKDFVEKNETSANQLISSEIIDSIKDGTISTENSENVRNILEEESKKEFKFEKNDSNDNELLVTEGENKYKISLSSEDDGSSKKSEAAAIFNEDSTVIFEVKDADCIVKVDNIQYIVTSTEENGVIINICKDDGTKGEQITKEEKMAEVQAKIEKKMQKFNKMMEEAKKFNESQAKTEKK